jgi:DHA1 family multidrug resistance protein-like MFS transporter
MLPWKRNLWIIGVCQFIAIGGMSMVVPFLPFYIRELGITQPAELKEWSSLVYAAPFFAFPIASPLWAMVGDKYGRKLMVLRAIFGLAATQIAISLVTSPTQLFIGRLAQGAFGGFIGAAQALVSTRTPRDELGYSLAFLHTSTAAGALAGPLFGGIVADTLGFRVAFWIVGLLCALSGAVVAWKVEEHPSERASDPEIRFMQRYRYLWRSAELRWCLLIALISSASTCAVQPVFALFVEQLAHTETLIATKTGFIVGVGALATLIASRFWGLRSDRHLYRSNVLWGTAVAALMLAAQALATSAWILIPLHFLESAFFCAISISLLALISRRTSERIRGGALSVLSSFSTIGALVGPLAGGALAARYGIPAAFYFAAALSIPVGFMSLMLRDEKPELSRHVS